MITVQLSCKQFTFLAYVGRALHLLSLVN